MNQRQTRGADHTTTASDSADKTNARSRKIWPVVITVAAVLIVAGISLEVNRRVVTFDRSEPAAASACPAQPEVPDAAKTDPSQDFAKASLARPADDPAVDLPRNQSRRTYGEPQGLYFDVDRLAGAKGLLPQGQLWIEADFGLGNVPIGGAAFVLTEEERDQPTEANDGRLALRLCIDPAMVGGIHPGEHPGTIKIRDKRLNGFDLPMLIRVQHPNAGWQLGGWFTLTATLVGLVGGFVAHQQIAERPWATRRFFEGFWNWFSRPQIVILAVGGLVAMVTLYLSRATNNSAFGATGEEFLELWAAMVAAMFTAVTVGGALKPPAKDPQNTPDIT